MAGSFSRYSPGYSVLPFNRLAGHLDDFFEPGNWAGTGKAVGEPDATGSQNQGASRFWISLLFAVRFVQRTALCPCQKSARNSSAARIENPQVLVDVCDGYGGSGGARTQIWANP